MRLFNRLGASVIAFIIIFLLLIAGAITLMINYNNTQPTEIVRQSAQNGDILQLLETQPTPDIGYSLDRYNLIRRAYWMSGDYISGEKLKITLSESDTVATPLPEGTVTLLSSTGTKIAEYKILGKVTSLNATLNPTSLYPTGSGSYSNTWLPSSDGIFGNNPEGIFFFTADNQYIEWTGDYIYTQKPVSSLGA